MSPMAMGDRSSARVFQKEIGVSLNKKIYCRDRSYLADFVNFCKSNLKIFWQFGPSSEHKDEILIIQTKSTLPHSRPNKTTHGLDTAQQYPAQSDEWIDLG